MKKVYEAPEAIELGKAGKLTLGDATQFYIDNCGCKTKTPPPMAW